MKKEDKETLIKVSLSDISYKLKVINLFFERIAGNYYKYQDEAIENRIEKNLMEKFEGECKSLCTIVGQLAVNRKTIGDAEFALKEIRKNILSNKK